MDANAIKAEGPRPPKLLDRLRHALRAKHYAYRTEQAYVQWVRRFILFQQKRHPQQMGKAEIEQFLTHLAVEGRVAASTQTQALCAILFLYNHVLQIELPRRVPLALPVLSAADALAKPVAPLRAAMPCGRVTAWPAS